MDCYLPQAIERIPRVSVGDAALGCGRAAIQELTCSIPGSAPDSALLPGALERELPDLLILSL